MNVKLLPVTSSAIFCDAELKIVDKTHLSNNVSNIVLWSTVTQWLKSARVETVASFQCPGSDFVSL